MVRTKRSEVLSLKGSGEGEEESKETLDDDYNLCGICFFSKIEMALQCGHTFCDQCISDWRKKQSSCPMCRFDHESTAFCLVENSMQETIAMRSDLL